MKITKFYETDYIDAASYDNLRKIASVADGLKNSGRKVIHTVIQKNINKDVKVSRIQSTISEFTDYLHGEDNLSDVIVNMARRYVGTNQLPLLKDEGNFGKRFKPKASAGRYIFTHKEPIVDKLFNQDDYFSLKHQTFEDMDIEPRYYIPVLPMLLINGSRDAVSTGFYQNILPRGVAPILKMVKQYVETGKYKIPKPRWDGFEGTITRAPDKDISKWITTGKWEKTSAYSLTITELPIGYNLVSYKKVLIKLEENKTIQSFTDKSDNEKFKYLVKVPRKFMEMTDDKITSILELNKNFTEHFNVMGRENRILEFTTPEEVFDEYVKIREDHYIMRKEYLIAKLTEDVKIAASKFLFIKGVVNQTIIIANTPKAEVEKQLDGTTGIIKRDDSYNYLLNMAIQSLTKELMEKIYNDIIELKGRLEVVKGQSIQDMWSIDLQLLEGKK